MTASGSTAEFHPPAAPSARRRWRQFSLRTLLLAMLVLAILFGLFAIRLQRARRQAAAVATIRGVGERVNYSKSKMPPWLIDWMGVDFVCRVRSVGLGSRGPARTPDEILKVWKAVEQLPTIEQLDADHEWVDRATIGRLRNHTRLRELRLMGGNLQDPDLEPLSGLTQLEELFLSENPIGDDGIKHLGHVPLTNLALRSTQIGDAGMALIADSQTLRVLQLGETQVGDQGAAEIAKIQTLRHLSLESTKITDTGLAHLSRLPKLRSLMVSETKVTDQGLLHLASLPDLESLEIGHTQVTGEAFARFRTDSKINGLVMIGCPVNEAGIRAIARLPQLKRLMLTDVSTPLVSLKEVDWPSTLEEVYFTNTSLSDEGLAQLAKCPNLKSIYAEGTQVTDVGLSQLVKCPNLKYLNIDGTQVTDAGLAQLVKCPNLTSVGVRRTQVTAEGIKQFKLASPKVTIGEP